MSALVIESPSRLGSVSLRDEFFPLTHKHGRVALEEALRCPEIITKRLATGLTPEQIQNVAFVDIETTGLSGGDHAFAFLVGIGTFDNLAFRVRQYFLAQPFNEAAMLAAVASTLKRCSHLVTFNGSSFDVPRLSARFQRAGIANPLPNLTHIDLLIPARRLFSHVLDSRRVAEIEARLLKASRLGDIDASEMGARYAAYVRRRNLSGLPPLFEHNSLDVRFLPAFLGYIGRLARNDKLDSEQLVALGRWAEEASDFDVARDCYEQAILLSDRQAAGLLARLLAKEGDWQECISIWTNETQSNDLVRRVMALDQLARIHQHQLRAPKEALPYALDAREQILQSTQQRRFVVTLPALEKRIARLQHRGTRAGGRSSA